MSFWDYIVVGLYFSLVFAISTFLGKSQKSLKDYFLGSRNLPWWAVAFSGIATITSAISYIGAVGLGYNSDFSFLQYRMAIPFAILIICVVILPFFYNLQLYSIYEYLEKRFSLSIRLISSAIFILFKASFLAIGIFAPALILQALTGANVYLIILMTGLITTVYTLLGGIKAVIWTDSLQLVILFGGIVAVIISAVSAVDGGLKEVLAIGEHYNKFQFIHESSSLQEPYTIWNGLLGGTFLMVSQFGTDQSELQRFLTTRSLRKSKIALISSLIIASFIGFLIFFEGTALFAFYKQRGIENIPGNKVFIKYVIEELPEIVRGCLVAAIFSAAMSTISSVLNSMSTVLITDFFQRFRPNKAPDVKMARIITLVLGLFSTILACFGGLLGNILEASTSIINFFGGVLVGVFLLGMLFKKAGTKAALAGMILGMAAVLFLATCTNVSFMWYSFTGAMITMLTGWLTSSIWKEPVNASQQALVFRFHKSNNRQKI